ncbi:MAG: carboxypeptidase-like regulatory domain-containing protein, partial [Bacteroidales bacterium]|nr:carboxypeptidase-like regulatory domain-containing protein [Bacteroidales bacterium]
MRFNKSIRGKALAVCLLASSLVAYSANEISTLQASMQAQQDNTVKISGTVLDENNSPAVGAFVTEDGTTNGTSTDFDGKWTLVVKKGATISVSFMGYLSETATVYGPGTFNFVLKPDNEFLEESVVIGYGSVKK